MGKGLCSNVNETYATLSTNIKEIITVEDNQIKGLIGHSIDKLLESPEKRKYASYSNSKLIKPSSELDAHEYYPLRIINQFDYLRCRVIGNAIGGEKLNGSYSGNLGLLQRHIADFYLRFEAPLILEPWLEMTFPVLIDKFALFKYNHQNCSNLRLAQKLLSGVFLLNEDRSTSYRAQMLFFEFFIIIIQLLLTNNIKTNKVVVDTSDIIQTKEEMFETKRTACWLENETEQKIAELFKGSILNRILNEKTKLKQPIIDYETKTVIERCIMKISLEAIQMIDLGDKFSLIRQNTGYVASAIFSSFKKKENAFWYIGGKPIYEINQIFYYTRHRLTTAYMNKMMYQKTEMGFIVKMYEDMNFDAKNSFNQKNPLYENLDDFLNDNTGFDNLSLENFENIFKLFTLSSLVIVFTFSLSSKLKNYFN